MAGTAESLLRPLISKKNGAEELGGSGSWVSSGRHRVGVQGWCPHSKLLDLGAQVNLIFCSVPHITLCATLKGDCMSQGQSSCNYMPRPQDFSALPRQWG